MTITSCCILGGSGFVGSHLAARLATKYRHIKIITRRESRCRHLSVLPAVEIIEADVHDPNILVSQLVGCDTVINLIGILNPGSGPGQQFRSAHVELARTLVEACQANGVSRLLHVGALNADAGSGSSEYLRSKGEAENYLFSFATKQMRVSSFRPSVIFGPVDSFCNRFASLLKIMPVFPLACPNARFAPVYVGDLVDTICATLSSNNRDSRHYDICGPREYTLRELVEYTAKTLGLKRAIINLPNSIARIQAAFMEHMPGKPFSRDNYLSLQTDSICTAGCDLQPTAIESVVPGYLNTQNKQDHLQRLRQLARRT